MAYIKAISYYLPRNILTTEQLCSEFGNNDIEHLAKTAGVKIRHIAESDETSADMAIKAAELLFEKHPIAKDEIDFVLYCTQSSDFQMPSSSCIIQDKLGLPTSIGALTFDLGCSGYVYGLALANSLVNSHMANNVLLITSDTISKYIHHSDKNRVIFGDAATATIISKEGVAELSEFNMGTDGSGYEHIIIRNGGNRHIQKDGSKNDWFEMDGEAIFSFTVDCLPELITETLKKNHMTEKDIDFYVFHQANKYMLNTIRKICKISKDKFYINLEDCGNTTSSTIPIGLARSFDDNTIKKGMNVMIAGFGVGLSWASTILKL